MDIRSNVVLITGITGFTGKYLKEFLIEKGLDVYGTTNQNFNTDSKTFFCDITDYNQIEEIVVKVKPCYVFHLAAISFVQHNNNNEMYNVNVLGTQNLLNACKIIKSVVKKVVIASSATIYGTQNCTVLHENLCPNPINHYGISKLAMEQIVKTYSLDLSIIITRPFNYTAPGQGEQFVIPKIAKAFKEGKQILDLGNLDVYREYNSIKYVCEVYYKLMQSDVVSETVNIASGKTYSLHQILEIFSKKAGYKMQIKINQKFVRTNELKSLEGSVEKLNSLIQINQENLLEETITSFLL